MADEKLTPLTGDGQENAWCCVMQFEAPGNLMDEMAVSDWAGATLRELNLPQPHLERVIQAAERALVSFIGRDNPSEHHPKVLVRVLVSEGAAATADEPLVRPQVGLGNEVNAVEPSERAWGLFVVERVDSGQQPGSAGGQPAIDIYLYAEGENGG